jgi:hypothetical protein
MLATLGVPSVETLISQAVPKSIRLGRALELPLPASEAEALGPDPALVNSAPTGDGWLWKMKLSDESQLDGLMDEAAYNSHIG